MKVTRKFTLALICGILLVHAISAAIRVHQERALFENDISRDAQVIGRTLGYAVERAWHTGGETAAMEIIQYATDHESHVHIRWVWLDAPPGRHDSPVVRRSKLKPLTRGQSVLARSREGDGILYTYVPVRMPVDRLGAIEIADSLTDEQDYLANGVQTAVVSALILVLVCGLIAALLGYHLIGQPVRRLVVHARSVGRGEFDVRLALPVNDELGELALEMDNMTDNLQRARQQLERETQSRIAAIEQLRHADRLTMVGTLASGVAHELGTPINVIEGHAQLLWEDPALGAQPKTHAQAIVRQCQRMTHIIRQLLDMARHGRRVQEGCDARRVAVETLRMVEPLVRKQKIKTVLDEGLGDARASTSASDLQQVLINLVVNAIHAMPDGGRLSLRVSREQALRPADGQQVQVVAVAVEDTGAGMDGETQKRVFEPFFTTKDVGQGTGLGLAVAFGIAKDNKGWLDVRSTLGVGSTFTLYLPAERIE